MTPVFKRAAGRCKAADAHLCIPFEQRTERISQLGCAGCTRYRAYECRIFRNKSGTAEVMNAFVSY